MTHLQKMTIALTAIIPPTVHLFHISILRIIPLTSLTRVTLAAKQMRHMLSKSTQPPSRSYYTGSLQAYKSHFVPPSQKQLQLSRLKQKQSQARLPPPMVKL
jgi:hypothetical protein